MFALLPPHRPGLPGSAAGPITDPRMPYAGTQEPTIKQRLRILQRHWWVVTLGIVAGVGIAGYGVYTDQPDYRAKAVVRLVDQRQSMTSGIDNNESAVMGWYTDQVLSELQLLYSRAVASSAVDAAGLRLRPLTGALSPHLLTGIAVATGAPADTLSVSFAGETYHVQGKSGRAEAPYGQPVELPGIRFAIRSRPAADTATIVVAARESAIQGVLGGIRGRAREGTNVVDVEFTADDPYYAQAVVNAVALAFREQNAGLAQKQSTRRRIFIADQLRQADSTLVEAQHALSAFRAREQVFSTREKLAARQTSLLELEMRREELSADRDMLAMLLARLEGPREPGTGEALGTLVSAPGTAGNPVVAQLISQLVQYETALDSLTTGRWASAGTNPDVQRLEGLVATTRQRLSTALRSHLGSIEARISALGDLRDRNASDMSSTPRIEAEESWLLQELTSSQSLAELLRQELQKARIAEAVEAGTVEIVDLAVPPEVPINDGRNRKLFVGLLLGMLLGGGCVFLLENMNTSIRGKEDIEGVLRVPGLAVIPRLELNGHRSLFRLRARRNGNGLENGRVNGNGAHIQPPIATTGRELVTLHETNSSASEAYRKLRTNLLFSRAGDSLKTVVITSMSKAEGKTITAANLAACLAQQGKQVLLVDCDLRRACIHKIFRMQRGSGLTDLLVRYRAAAEVIQPTDIEQLFVLTAGTPPPNPSELIGSAEMRNLLTSMSESFEILILDTPPVAATADAAVLGVHVDGVVLVVRAGDTERDAALQAVQQLTSVGARVLGAVLNDPDSKVRKYDGHYYYYHYHHSYGSEAHS